MFAGSNSTAAKARVWPDTRVIPALEVKYKIADKDIAITIGMVIAIILVRLELRWPDFSGRCFSRNIPDVRLDAR